MLGLIFIEIHRGPFIRSGGLGYSNLNLHSISVKNETFSWLNNFVKMQHESMVPLTENCDIIKHFV